MYVDDIVLFVQLSENTTAVVTHRKQINWSLNKRLYCDDVGQERIAGDTRRKLF